MFLHIDHFADDANQPVATWIMHATVFRSSEKGAEPCSV
jgi:hypothetical protein